MKYYLQIVMVVILLLQLTGCSTKTKVKQYNSFTKIDRPGVLHLRIKKDSKSIEAIKERLSILEKRYKNNHDLRVIRKYLLAIETNDSKIKAIKLQKAKILILEKILDTYESDIDKYREWLKKR